MQRHVLVVDTDLTLAERVRRALRGRCVTVWAVASAEDAYRRIAAIPTLDALVLDVDLGSRREVVRFAHSVIPDVGVVYIGAREAAHGEPALLSCEAGQVSRAAEREPEGAAGALQNSAPSTVNGGGWRTLWLETPFGADEIVSSVLSACVR